MITPIFVDPEVTDEVIRVNGRCYHRVGASAHSPNVSSGEVQAEYDDCNTCTTTQCYLTFECEDLLSGTDGVPAGCFTNDDTRDMQVLMYADVAYDWHKTGTCTDPDPVNLGGSFICTASSTQNISVMVTYLGGFRHRIAPVVNGVQVNWDSGNPWLDDHHAGSWDDEISVSAGDTLTFFFDISNDFGANWYSERGDGWRIDLGDSVTEPVVDCNPRDCNAEYGTGCFGLGHTITVDPSGNWNIVVSCGASIYSDTLTPMPLTLTIDGSCSGAFFTVEPPYYLAFPCSGGGNIRIYFITLTEARMSWFDSEFGSHSHLCYRYFIQVITEGYPYIINYMGPPVKWPGSPAGTYVWFNDFSGSGMSDDPDGIAPDGCSRGNVPATVEVTFV